MAIACRDRGTNRVPGPVTTDHEGDPRAASGRVDVGADEFYPHPYVTGKLTTPGGLAHIKIIGKPGTPAYWVYSLTPAVLDPPIEIPGLGKWYLEPPVFPVFVGTLPATGIIIVPVPLEPRLPAPRRFPMQALIGFQLSNLYLAEVK